MDNKAVIRALESSETTATVLYALLNRLYGEAWLDWDLTTLYLELRAEFSAEPAQEVVDKIGALQTLVTTDAFFSNPSGFMGICNTLSGGDPGFAVFDPVSVPEAAWALTEVAFIRDFLPFSYAVKTVMLAILREDGYTDDYPEVFDIVLENRPATAQQTMEAMFRELRDDVKRGVEEYVNEMLMSLVYQFNLLDMNEDLQRLMRMQKFDEVADEAS